MRPIALAQKLDADRPRKIEAEDRGDPVGFGDVQKAWGQWKGIPAGGGAATFLSGDAPGSSGAHATGRADPAARQQARAKVEEIPAQLKGALGSGWPAGNRGERGTGETAHTSRVPRLPAFGQV